VDLSTNSDYFLTQTERERKQTVGHAVTATSLLSREEKTENFNVLKVPRHYPLVPSATVKLRIRQIVGN
jgi:hypothetical protein